jgi:hypothetical protein
MKNIVVTFILCLISALSSGQDISAQLNEAATATKPDYLILRNRIIAQGAAAEPQLEAILRNESVSSQERMLAGICLERIRRGDEIEAFIKKDWHDLPELRDDPGWMSHVGVPSTLLPMMRKELVALDLPYYELELLWKKTTEFNRQLKKASIWRDMSANALKEANNYFLPEVLLSYVQNDPQSYSSEASHFAQMLTEIGFHPAFQVIFDRWLTARAEGIKAMEKFGQNERRTDGEIARYLAFATAEDADWIAERLSKITLGGLGKGAYEDYLRRCKEGKAPLVKYKPGVVPIPQRKGASPFEVEPPVVATSANTTPAPPPPVPKPVEVISPPVMETPAAPSERSLLPVAMIGLLAVAALGIGVIIWRKRG